MQTTPQVYFLSSGSGADGKGFDGRAGFGLLDFRLSCDCDFNPSLKIEIRRT